MREFLISLILGTIIGLSSSYALFALEKPADESSVLSQTPESTLEPEKALESDKDEYLSIDNGKETILTIKDKAAIKAKYSGNSPLIFTSEDEHFLVEVKDGVFEIELKPKEKVEYHTFLANGLVYRVTTLLDSEGKSAMSGVITEISGESISIKESDGEIKTLSKDGQTKVLNLSDTKMEQAEGDSVFLITNTESTYVHEIIVPKNTYPKLSYTKGSIKTFDRFKIEVSQDSDAGLFTFDMRKNPKLYGVTKEGKVRNRTKLIQSDLGRDSIIISGDNISKAVFIFD